MLLLLKKNGSGSFKPLILHLYPKLFTLNLNYLVLPWIIESLSFCVILIVSIFIQIPLNNVLMLYLNLQPEFLFLSLKSDFYRLNVFLAVINIIKMSFWLYIYNLIWVDKWNQILKTKCYFIMQIRDVILFFVISTN